MNARSQSAWRGAAVKNGPGLFRAAAKRILRPFVGGHGGSNYGGVRTRGIGPKADAPGASFARPGQEDFLRNLLNSLLRCQPIILLAACFAAFHVIFAFGVSHNPHDTPIRCPCQDNSPGAAQEFQEMLTFSDICEATPTTWNDSDVCPSSSLLLSFSCYSGEAVTRIVATLAEEEVSGLFSSSCLSFISLATCTGKSASKI
jgi:hypothetical protein